MALLNGLKQSGVPMSDSSGVFFLYQRFYQLPHATIHRLLKQLLSFLHRWTIVLHGAEASPYHAPFPAPHGTLNDLVFHVIIHDKFHHSGNQRPLVHLHEDWQSIQTRLDTDALLQQNATHAPLTSWDHVSQEQVPLGCVHPECHQVFDHVPGALLYGTL
jgi:hypothetical protein